jgi:hypothetical protein
MALTSKLSERNHHGLLLFLAFVIFVIALRRALPLAGVIATATGACAAMTGRITTLA